MKTSLKLIILAILFSWMCINIVLVVGEPAGKPFLFAGFTNLLGLLSTYIETQVVEWLADKGLIIGITEED